MATFDAATYQTQIKAHATLLPVGFLVLLPLGMFIPRYARTFTNKWFYGHAIFQLVFAGPIIVTGFAFAVHAVQLTVSVGAGQHFVDSHTKTGLALFILYVVQVLLGITSHFFNRPSIPFLLYRAPQRWLHIGVGLAIISLAFYQVHLGYTYEWPNFVGTPVPAAVDKAWKAWVIIVPILYVAGLAFLPRQLSQESAKRKTTP